MNAFVRAEPHSGMLAFKARVRVRVKVSVRVRVRVRAQSGVLGFKLP